MKYQIVEAGRYIALSYLAGAAGRILWSMASDYFFAGHRKTILLMIAFLLFFLRWSWVLSHYFLRSLPYY